MAARENSITEQTNPTTLPSDEGKQPQLSDRQLARTREERIEMVRHLVDTLKLDVNARDQPPGWMLGNFFSRPLHYIAHKSSPKAGLQRGGIVLAWAWCGS